MNDIPPHLVIRRFLGALRDLQIQEQAYFTPKEVTTSDKASTQLIPPGEAYQVGWYGKNKSDQRRLYLLTDICLQMVKEHWERAGETFDMLPDALRRQLSQAGLLIQKDPLQFELCTYIPNVGQCRRVAVIDVKKAEKMLDGASLWPKKIYDQKKN